MSEIRLNLHEQLAALQQRLDERTRERDRLIGEKEDAGGYPAYLHSQLDTAKGKLEAAEHDRDDAQKQVDALVAGSEHYLGLYNAALAQAQARDEAIKSNMLHKDSPGPGEPLVLRCRQCYGWQDEPPLHKPDCWVGKALAAASPPQREPDAREYGNQCWWPHCERGSGDAACPLPLSPDCAPDTQRPAVRAWLRGEMAGLEPLSKYHRPSHPGSPAYNRCVECFERWPCDAIHLIALERSFDRTDRS